MMLEKSINVILLIIMLGLYIYFYKITLILTGISAILSVLLLTYLYWNYKKNYEDVNTSNS